MVEVFRGYLRAKPQARRTRLRLSKKSLAEDGEDVALLHDEDVIASRVGLELIAGPDREEDEIALLDLHAAALAVLHHAAGADRQDPALLRLTPGTIRQHDAARAFVLGLRAADDYPISQWLYFHGALR